MWRCFPFAILWPIWVERTYRILGDKPLSFDDCASMVFLNMIKWSLKRKEFLNVKSNDILHN